VVDTRESSRAAIEEASVRRLAASDGLSMHNTVVVDGGGTSHNATCSSHVVRRRCIKRDRASTRQNDSFDRSAEE
jgi:hypothetical protein